MLRGTVRTFVLSIPPVSVSVVISTCNRAESLAIALRSLSEQRVPAGLYFEVIVVDNNSSDETRAVVERFSRGVFAHLRYIFEPRQGVALSRNVGITAARGDIIAFTDDDNAVASDWVASVKRILDDRPDIAALGGAILPQWPETPPPWLDRLHWSPVAIVDYGPASFEANAQNPVCLLTANLAVRREVLHRVGLFSPAFPRCSDHEFLIRFWQAGFRALYVPGLVVHARVQTERLTRRYHRRWHTRHGAFAADMRLQEIIGPTGALLDGPVRAATIMGGPTFVYRELLHEAAWWLLETVRRRRSKAFHHGNRVRFLTGYLRRRADSASAPPAPGLLPVLRSHLTSFFSAAGLPAHRLLCVYSLMVLFIGGSIVDILHGTEHWPLSSYPMFSVVDLGPRVRLIRLFGVTQGPSRQEVELLDASEIYPFDQCRLSTALAATHNNQARRHLTDALLGDVLLRYEKRRIAGGHHGPALDAVRAYEMTWTLHPDAANVDAWDQKVLVAEVSRSGRTAQ
jgi:glucosyl-dolichyl phosphate glucuronosyltransferase